VSISWDDFEAIGLKAGTIVRAEINEGAKKPAYKLWVDLGPELGVKTSSAQLTHLYTPETLIGKQVLCVTNFPPRRINGFSSEILVCGFYREDGAVVLASPDSPVPNGAALS
jgi:tRNA-binding protein